MIKRLNLILNGKGGIGKISDCLLHHLGQPLKTAVRRLVLCKPFLATAAVWLYSAARRCELRLRFCIRKTCPALGTIQHQFLRIFMMEIQLGKISTYDQLVTRQSEIEEQLDLTKNQAPNQLEASENIEANVISEQPEQVEPQTIKPKRGIKV